MNTINGSIALGAVALLATAGTFALTVSAVASVADTSARITCRREAALALISDTHCAARKAGATSTAWGY